MDVDDESGSSSAYVNLQTSRAVPSSSSSSIDHTSISTATGTGTGMAPSAPASQSPPPPTTVAPPPTNGGDPDYRIVPLPHQLPHHQLSTNEFCTNVVITSKYTPWNFLPLFMLESFKKLANAYFLLVSVLQCIPAISNTNGLPTNLPVLVFILGVDAMLAIIEDRRRHAADHDANSAQCQVITSTFHVASDGATGNTGNLSSILTPTDDPEISILQWSELTVGTIVKLRNRETAPADLLILAVSEPHPQTPNGICYVETKSLDGETNLKLRHACDATLQALTPRAIQALTGFVRCENPNRVIGRFDGTLTVTGASSKTTTSKEPSSNSSSSNPTTQQPVTIKNILLRGCQLRNTEWIYGLVLNTGPDTKIMQSAAKPRPKWSSINEMVNTMILWLFALLCLLCAIATSAQIGWLHANKTDSLYLQYYPEFVSQWFIGFGYYFLLMYQMIPVSLYVTISMVMFIQAIFMVWDVDMYYEDLDVRMIVRSMGLNEELGQISYVFSDKTGTLTCNVMEFRKCSINGISYGTGTTEIGRAALRRKGIHVAEEEDPKTSQGRPKIPYVNFEDPRLTSKLQENDQTSLENEFFLHLSLCHTVIPEVVEGTDEVRLSASSPDEQALVSGAKFFGYHFDSRGLGIARVRVFHPSKNGLNGGKNDAKNSELIEYKILDVLEFTSDRKRMSVIAQYPNGQYWILTKGADNMIYPLLSKTKNHPDLLQDTLRHLETFGEDGLRTLTIARRQLSENEYLQWAEKFKKANSSLEEIEKRKQGLTNEIDILMSEIEKDLVLLGATAIEDKLQQFVPRAISNLMRASMKVWMLTGDKQETAINISYACQLMDNDMTQIVLNMELFPTKDLLLAHLQAANDVPDQEDSQEEHRQAVVIDGECLEVTLLDDQCRHAFLKLAMQCEAVVCCRVSPSQKAEIVSLVRKENPKVRTLAIGDGANDVAMIQRAHVGVGICGQEGMQAVNSSDYAIGQFFFLEKLLLHHGRLNYKRMAILAGYMFYKNIVMVLAQYFYMFSTGVSGQKFYSELGFQLYNLAYTSLPIIVLGVFDYDVPWLVGQQFPELYQVGPKMELFNTKTFFKWIASAVFESGMIAFFVIYGFNDEFSNTGSATKVQYGLATFTLVVLVCNLKLVVLQMSWTLEGGILWFLGVLSFIPVTIIISSYWVTMFSVDFGSFQNTLVHESFWLLLPVCCIAAMLRNFSWAAFQRRFYPEPWQIVQEQYVLSKSSTGGEGGLATPISMEAGEVEAASDHDRAYLAVRDHGAAAAGQHAAVAGGQVVSERKKRVSSGFAFSYDPQTTMAESYMASHSVSSASSAMNEAESRQRVSRENSRSSDFGDSFSNDRNDRGSDHSANGGGAAQQPHRQRSSSTGLFV